jgi:hypothetical protein
LARKVNFSLPGFDKVGANEKGQHVSLQPEPLFAARQINKGELSHVQF